MSLRPLLDIAAENERVHALCGRVRAAADGGEAVDLRASAMLRPLLLATLLEDAPRLAGRPPGPPGQPRRPLRPRPRRRFARLPGPPPGPSLPLARDRLRLQCQP